MSAIVNVMTLFSIKLKLQTDPRFLGIGEKCRCIETMEAFVAGTKAIKCQARNSRAMQDVFHV